MEGSSIFLFARREWLHLFWVILIVLLSLIYYARWRKKAFVIFGSEKNVSLLVASLHQKLRSIRNLLFLIGLCFLVIAASGPMWGKKAVIVKSRGKDVMFIVDISTSMLAEDIKPNRLARAKLELSQLLVGLSGNRIGLIIFSGDSFVLCPLTLDTGACELLIDCIQAGNMPRPGTSLSGAIQQAVKSFEAGENEYKAVVLISDGEDLEGEIDGAVSEAKENGLRVFTLGVGTTEGAPIPIRGEDGSLKGYKKDRTEETVITRLNEALMKDIADDTGGEYYRLGNGGTRTDDLVESIVKMDEKVLAEEEVQSYKERFQYPLLLAFLFFVAEAFLGERRRVNQ